MDFAFMIGACKVIIGTWYFRVLTFYPNFDHCAPTIKMTRGDPRDLLVRKDFFVAACAQKRLDLLKSVPGFLEELFPHLVVENHDERRVDDSERRLQNEDFAVRPEMIFEA